MLRFHTGHTHRELPLAHSPCAEWLDIDVSSVAHSLSGMAMLVAVLAWLLWPLYARADDGWTPPPNLAVLQAQFRQPAEIPFPADNLFTAERELLGRTLFFDPRLSGSGVLACATCHNPSFGWGDGLRLGRGEGLQLLGRRTPTILNAAWDGPYFWDGRAPSLEDQAAGPMGSAKEMNGDLVLCVSHIAG